MLHDLQSVESCWHWRQIKSLQQDLGIKFSTDLELLQIVHTENRNETKALVSVSDKNSLHDLHLLLSFISFRHFRQNAP